MLSILFNSLLIRYSDTGSAFKDTQSALEHLKHSESSRRALRGTLAFGEHSSTWMALGHSNGTRAPDTRAIKTLEHSNTNGTQPDGQLGT